MVTKAHGVEGSGIDGLVDLVSTGDGVRREQGDDLKRREVAGIGETLEDRGDAVLGLRDQANDGGNGVVGAASQKLELRSTLSKLYM